MANLKEVRERISSVKSTQQITKAMKMVSAAKLKKAQDAITQMRPYANQLNKMLVNILSNLEGQADTSFGTVRDVIRPAIVVITSNRGLCGAFNTNVVKQAVEVIQNYQDAYRKNNLSIICIGKKGYDGLKNKYPNANFVTEHIDLFSNLTFDHIRIVAQLLMDRFEQKDYDRIEVCYGRFKNPAVQFPETEQFLPVPKLEKTLGDKSHKADYIFEPNKQTLLDKLIPSILQTKFQKYLLDTHASEHGARMTAMDKATDNAEDMLKELKISYNKARQEAITSELSEIVGGAAALGG